ncbi:MAG: shikimate kinase [Bacillales bacterium]|nr:shikimate kinase [Bacillales bacterium]
MNHNNFEMKTIFLIGMMGTGKSTIGKKLSRKLGFAFYDLDKIIEKKSQKTIEEIFSVNGETHFRDQEAKALRKTPLLSSVVATGGGIIENEANRNWIKQFGIGVLLLADDETILSRIRNDKTRPLLQNNPEQGIQELKQKRNLEYLDCAHFIIQTDDKSEDDIIKEIMKEISSNVTEYFV